MPLAFSGEANAPLGSAFRFPRFLVTGKGGWALQTSFVIINTVLSGSVENWEEAEWLEIRKQEEYGR